MNYQVELKLPESSEELSPGEMYQLLFHNKSEHPVHLRFYGGGHISEEGQHVELGRFFKQTGEIKPGQTIVLEEESNAMLDFHLWMKLDAISSTGIKRYEFGYHARDTRIELKDREDNQNKKRRHSDQ